MLLLFNTTRTTSGPPSTGAAIAMDGGVADTARAPWPVLTLDVLTPAVNRRSLEEERASWSRRWRRAYANAFSLLGRTVGFEYVWFGV